MIHIQLRIVLDFVQMCAPRRHRVYVNDKFANV
jgi:hypothetical protein